VNDVTEEYSDLELRLSNFRKVREQLLKVLDDKAKKVAEILEVERELARVGGEIEVMEGRLKNFDRQIDWATVTVLFYDQLKGVFANIQFGDKFYETLRMAAETAVNTCSGLIVLIACLLPMALLVLLVIFVIRLWKLFFRR
jgi:hypothetical protein